MDIKIEQGDIHLIRNSRMVVFMSQLNIKEFPEQITFERIYFLKDDVTPSFSDHNGSRKYHEINEYSEQIYSSDYYLGYRLLLVND